MKIKVPWHTNSRASVQFSQRSSGDPARLKSEMTSLATVAVLLVAACLAISSESTASSYPALPPATEVEIGGSVGAAYQLSLERLRKPPYDSVAYLRADLTHELQRMFTNYSGDVSGRYLEVAALTSTPPDFPQIMEALIDTLPAPQPDGHFGAAVDWSQPLEDPNPLTAVTMPIYWGHSRLLVGLIEAYEATGQLRLLELARGIGDFYLSTADRFLDPEREAEYRSSGTYAASTVTCYFPGIEGLVRLYRVTGEDRYLEQARRMADFFPEYDRLPLDHCHGSLLTHQALLMLHETTGDRAYLEPVLERWDEAMTEGYVWVTGGVGEHFRVGAGFDEGCALADWLRLNLDLWRLSTDTKYLDAAERLLVNHFAWNRYPNGGYGQLIFEGDDSGPNILQPGHHGREGTWCCSFHGLLALHDFQRFVLAGSHRGIFINFPFEAAARIQAMGVNWRVATTSFPTAGDDRQIRISVAGDGHNGQPVPILVRRPSWSAGVEVVDDRAVSVATTEEHGYVCFEATPGVSVTATFLVRPRMEDRRFHVLAPDPSKISRYSRIVFAAGPELLMANAENPPVVVIAVGPDGQPVLPASIDGVRSVITVDSLDASETAIGEAIRTGALLKVGPWNATSRETAIAFVFNAIAVPSESALGQSLLAHYPGN